MDEEKSKKVVLKTPKFSVFMALAGLFLVFLCITVVLILYYFYLKDQEDKLGNEDQKSEESQETANEQEVENASSQEVDSENETETTEFVGTYITADLPTDWIITEYEDGNGGYGILSDGIYDGLTAFTVAKPDGTVVFKVEGVNGIGGTGECSQVYQFSDTEASYVTQMQNEAVALGSPMPSVSDLSAQDYTEFELLGLEGRFVGNGVYWNVATSGSGIFNPACNMLQVNLDGTTLSFDYTYSGTTMTIDSYIPGVTGDFEYIDAEGLSIVLESITVN